MKNLKLFGLLLVIMFITGFISAAVAANLAPQWVALTTEQKQYLLEAFSIDANQQKLYWNPLPENMKQFIIDSMWKSIPPEKQQQVLIYAHIDKPFTKASDATSNIPAPKWVSLTARQQGQLTEAFGFDSTQLTVWNTLPNEIRQLYVDSVWPYIPSEKKQLILSSGGTTANYNTTQNNTGYTGNTNTTYTGTTTGQSQAPKWSSLNAQQQQALMVLFNFDSTKMFIWNTMTPELKQMFIDYVWQYFTDDVKQLVMAGNATALQAVAAQQTGTVIPPPQWASLDPEEQGKLTLMLKLDPSLWNMLPNEGKQFFLNTVWSFVPLNKQKEIINEID